MGSSERIESLRRALTAAGFEVQPDGELEAARLIARRAEWKTGAAHMHEFVAAFCVDGLSDERAEVLTAAAVQYAIDHKGGLPRGMQTGTMTIALFITRAYESLKTWFSAEPHHRYAAPRFPVLADQDTGALTYFTGHMTRGWVYAPDLKRIVERTIKPALTA